MYESVTVKFKEADRKERFFRKQNVRKPLSVKYEGVFLVVVTSDESSHSFPAADIQEVITLPDSCY